MGSNFIYNFNGDMMLEIYFNIRKDEYDEDYWEDLNPVIDTVGKRIILSWEAPNYLRVSNRCKAFTALHKDFEYVLKDMDYVQKIVGEDLSDCKFRVNIEVNYDNFEYNPV